MGGDGRFKIFFRDFGKKRGISFLCRMHYLPFLVLVLVVVVVVAGQDYLLPSQLPRCAGKCLGKGELCCVCPVPAEVKLSS